MGKIKLKFDGVRRMFGTERELSFDKNKQAKGVAMNDSWETWVLVFGFFGVIYMLARCVELLSGFIQDFSDYKMQSERNFGRIEEMYLHMREDIRETTKAVNYVARGGRAGTFIEMVQMLKEAVKEGQQQEGNETVAPTSTAKDA
ncbi:hypothetical protein [Magnetofaba australis]|uniref:Uncharacterized protein n=1 Tax=Magnetofaba australis IT-1 TaxID=1434232 RepID=A0A1Y2K2W5_9PROT|nr:hypothetical protein [Magnetofaba australis]OSM01946.1 hypothetical protein MAIT1_02011 [Magnetofaba australis IT-1]